MYSFTELNLLKAVCRGHAAIAGNQWRLKRMKAGRHPKSGEFLGRPVLIDPSSGVFGVLLGEDFSGYRTRQEGVRQEFPSQAAFRDMVFTAVAPKSQPGGGTKLFFVALLFPAAAFACGFACVSVSLA